MISYELFEVREAGKGEDTLIQAILKMFIKIILPLTVSRFCLQLFFKASKFNQFL